MTYNLEVVEWVDSRQPVSEWQFVRSVEEMPVVKCRSVGWVIGENDDVLTLAPNMGDIDDEDGDEQVSGVIRIPMKSVTNREQMI